MVYIAAASSHEILFGVPYSPIFHGLVFSLSETNLNLQDAGKLLAGGNPTQSTDF